MSLELQDENREKCRDLIAEHGAKALTYGWLQENQAALHRSLMYCKLPLKQLAVEFGIKAEWDAVMKTPKPPDLEKQQKRIEAFQQRNKEQCRALVIKHGGEALTRGWMYANDEITLYGSCKHYDLSFEDLASEFGIKDQWHAAVRASRQRSAATATQKRGQEVWTQELILEYAANLCTEYRCLPSSSWLALNGHSGFAGHVQAVGLSFPELRVRFSPGPAKNLSIDGVHWDSYTEAAVCNYLLARNVSVVPGRYYPAAFFDRFGRKGIYDMHFIATSAEYVDKEITVEIFCGGAVNGNPALLEKYQLKREMKESFHKGDPLFLALEYEECNDEIELQKKLHPFIGVREITVTYKDYASYQLPATKWSLTDDLVQQATEICTHFDDGKLPTSDWLCQTGPHKTRPKCSWEKDSYEWFREQVYQIGGWVVMRKLLGEEVPKTEWTQEELIEEFRLIYSKYKKTPSALNNHKIGRKKANTEEDRAWGNRAQAARVRAAKLFPGGHQEACIKADIPVRILNKKK